MTRFPSFEDALLEVHQSLGLRRDVRKKKFADLDMQIDNHAAMAAELLASIFDAFDMDDDACRDAIGNVMEWAGFHKAIELRTWTGNASQQQVLWHLLAYSYVPALARRLAFWTLHNIEHDRPPPDAGMPGGKFWFLPNWDRESDRIELPVTQVMGWLFELLAGQSLDKAIEGLERQENGGVLNSHALRTLQGWKAEGSTPKSAKKIEQIFSDDSALDFKGAFCLDEAHSAEEQFQAALQFVTGKGLSAEALRGEIPMSAERLEPILNGSAPCGEEQEFVRLVAVRYAKPEMGTVRQRLRVARMAQDGYQRLLNFLCPGVEETCTDPTRNKLLQLVGLFGTIYNLTIAAWKNSHSVEEQDAWFEAQLAPRDKEDLLLSILPSPPGEMKCSLLAERLARQFMSLSQRSPLEDLVPLREEDAAHIIERRLRLIKQERDEDARLEQLIGRIRAASPWRALQAEDSYWVVSQLVQRNDTSSEIRIMALQRLRDLAATPGQKVGADLLELGLLLNCEPKQRPKDVRQRVQSLLDEAEASPGYEEWRAPLLRLRARHKLMQNDFDEARADFKAALAACSERGFGGLRGEIARDGFAVEIAEDGFVPMNQERYYRNMLGYMEFPDGVPSFEDAAAECEEFFWSNLYRPYPGFEPVETAATVQFKAIFEETFGLIEEADWDGLQAWMRRHAKKFRTTKLKEARRNSVLLHWLKTLHRFEGGLPTLKALAPREAAGNLDVIELHMKNWREAIRLLLADWPEQAEIADFKGQTPLMLVADHGDLELTRLLAPMSDMEAQDYRGRTALHAAAAGRSPECVAVVLERNPDVATVTLGEENTALHTAVRFGVPQSVCLILEEFPGLATKANAAEQTPFEMARDIIENLSDWQSFMRKESRRTGSKADFEAIIALLKPDRV